MNLNINFNEVFVFIVLLIILYLFSGLLLDPLKGIFKLLMFCLAGLILLLLINLLGQYIELYIPINITTVLVSGILGIPGVILILAINMLILTI